MYEQKRRKMWRFGLTTLSCVGVLMSVLFSAKESKKADKYEKRNAKETIKYGLKNYPKTLVSTLSTLLLIGANYKISDKQISGLILATGAASGMYAKYKTKVDEVVKIAKDKILEDRKDPKIVKNDFLVDKFKMGEKDDISDWETIPPGEKILVYLDGFHKLIEVNKQDIILGYYLLNRDFNQEGTVCVGDLYQYIGVPMTDLDDEEYWAKGWDYDDTYGPEEFWIDYAVEQHSTDDGLKYYYVYPIWPAYESLVPVSIQDNFNKAIIRENNMSYNGNIL